jgi:CPA1 family monovalent cation:H+ antiporter
MVSITSVALRILVSVGGGILCGAAISLVLMAFSGRTRDPLVEFTLTTLVAYGSFLIAEHLGCSGVLASLTAGLIVGNFGARRAISQHGREILESFWEYIAFLANSIVFLLIGVRAAHQHFGAVWLAAVVAMLLVLIGRAVVIYGGCALMSASRRPVSTAYQHILVWG